MILELSGTILEAFWDDVRDLFLSQLRVLRKPASSSVFVVLGTFWLTSFAKFAKWQGSFPLDNSSNEIATLSLTRELANISGTKPKQCWDELRIKIEILTKTGKITS